MAVINETSINNNHKNHLDPNSPYLEIMPGTKVYQNSKGEYLPDSQQPKPQNQREYNPHQSTRYKNVFIGSNNKVQAVKFSKDKDGFYSSHLIETDKELPNLYTNRSDCCGCSACYAICPVRDFLPNAGKDSIGLFNEKYKLPHGAIYMEDDEEGFQYPVVDASLCIRCYKCINVCPIKKAHDQ